MVRYKRYRRYGRRRSTGIIRMKFQSFMDIATSPASMQIISINAGGPEVLRRLAAQFSAYKYYKLGNIAVKLVPASTLPCSPSGLGYEVGESTVDPRDQLTPGMMRITNGEDVFENISGLTDDQQRGIYNNMLLDPRWFKWMLQSGVKRHATPRYWQVGQLHQDKWPGAINNVPLVNSDGLVGTSWEVDYAKPNDAGTAISAVGMTAAIGSSPFGLMQTGHSGRLGWMPTDGLQNIWRTSGDGGAIFDQPMLASPPECEVMKIVLPKSFKTRYYYRAFITETVYFKEPIVNFGVTSSYGTYRPLDVFHLPSEPVPYQPATSYVSDFPEDVDTGGNYGHD